MNILIVTPGFPTNMIDNVSGKFVLNEAVAYLKNGASVKVITPIYKGAPRFEVFDNGIEVARFRYFWPYKLQKIADPIDNIYDNRGIMKYINIPFFAIAFIFSILKYSKKADIIHCQWTTSVLFALPAKWIRKCKIIVTARGSDIRLMPVWLNRYIMKRVDASIDCYGPQEWNNNLKKNFQSNYITLPLIINTFEDCSFPDDLKDIFTEKQQYYKLVYLGRLDPVKIEVVNMPITILIDAIFQLKKKGYKILLVFIGSGDANLIEKMKNKIDQLGLTNEIFLIGSKSEPNKYIQHFDLGIGGDVLNAVSQEFAISKIPQVHVKYNQYSSTSIWSDGNNMLLFEPNNIQSLEKQIEFAIENPSRMSDIKNNAYNFIKNYVAFPEEGGKQYLDAFKNLLK